MAKLFDQIRTLVASGRYVVSHHAVERLEERGILEWQVVDGLENAKDFDELPTNLPDPLIEVYELLPDGTEVKAVWAHLISLDIAKLVTVHFLD